MAEAFICIAKSEEQTASIVNQLKEAGLSRTTFRQWDRTIDQVRGLRFSSQTDQPDSSAGVA